MHDRGATVTTDDYEFTADWFDGYRPFWQKIFAERLPACCTVLEIGCYEGRSTAWLVQNAFGPERKGDLFCVDLWPEADVEKRFDHNLAVAQARAPLVRAHKLKSASAVALPWLLAGGHRDAFDFIYVDGGHTASDVLTDLVFAFGLCRVGGIIGCDDYLWRDPEAADDILRAPKLGIDAFLNCFFDRIHLIPNMPLYQVFLAKSRN